MSKLAASITTFYFSILAW